MAVMLSGRGRGRRHQVRGIISHAMDNESYVLADTEDGTEVRGYVTSVGLHDFTVDEHPITYDELRTFRVLMTPEET